MHARKILIILGVAASLPVSAADVPFAPARNTATLFHAGGINPEARGDVLVGAQAASRDSLLPVPPGEIAFYDDAPGCTFFQTNVFPLAHRFVRLCR